MVQAYNCFDQRNLVYLTRKLFRLLLYGLEPKNKDLLSLFDRYSDPESAGDALLVGVERISGVRFLLTASKVQDNYRFI